MSNKNIIKILALFAIYVVSTGIVTAEAPPGIPMELHGDVSIGGSPAPAGTTIDARVGTDVKSSTKVINSGKYGDKNNYLGAYASSEGTNIDIYVNGVKVATVAYIPGERTKLDLNAPGGTSGGAGGTTGGSSGSTGGGGGVAGAGGVTPKATAIQQQAAAKETGKVTTTGTPAVEPTAAPPKVNLNTILGVFGLLAIGAIAIYALKKMGKI